MRFGSLLTLIMMKLTKIIYFYTDESSKSRG